MDRFIRKELIDKGWSGDKKYRVVDANGRSFLLRVSPTAKRERTEGAFHLMQRVEALDVPMCRALEIGDCGEGVYTLQTWIDGEASEDFIPRLSPDKQYEYGVQAGEILRKIHSLPAPADAEPWDARFNAKIDRKLRGYADCPLKYARGERFMDYVNAHRHLLTGRPQAMHHGDYHTGNMMIDTDGNLVVIDFDRYDCGDPWEEFNRIVWCIAVSHEFASGMVDGYFGGDIPLEFWQLLALYICTNALSSLPWAIPFGEGEIATMRAQADDILRWYDDMTSVIPNWYIHH